MKYLYLTVNLGAVIVPFIFSFHHRINFYKEFRAALSAISMVALPFIVWDMHFTRQGVWGFNPDYVTGAYIGNVPLEEVMFFFCIPFSCLFTYFVLRRELIKDFRMPGETAIGVFLGVSFIAAAVSVSHLLYTGWTLFFLGIAVITAALFMRRFFTRFLISYLLLLIPFFIVNGILTGTGIDKEVVWYNNGENLGIRALTIPVEDFFYGMLMILLNFMAFEQLSAYFNRRYAATPA